MDNPPVKAGVKAHIPEAREVKRNDDPLRGSRSEGQSHDRSEPVIAGPNLDRLTDLVTK